MIKNIIKPEKLYLYEPTLQKLFNADKLESIILEANSEIIIDLKNQGYKNWQTCYPLDLAYLTEPITNYASEFIEDEIERNLLVIQSDGSCNFKFYGKNDDNKVFILKNFDNTGNYESVFFENYKYYKVELSNCSFNYFYAYLININFYKANIYKALEIALRGLSTSQQDTWFEKANLYKQDYEQEIQGLSVDIYNEETRKSEISYGNVKSIRLER